MTVSTDSKTPGASTAPAGETQVDQDSGRIDWVVTGWAAALVLAVVIWGLAAPEKFSNFASAALGYIVTDWGWLFILAGTTFVGFILFIAFSRFGHIRLGKDGEEPEFNTISWIAMMFAAGMGIGLMFYGVTEPLTFFRNGVAGSAPENTAEAFATTIFHWGLHPWSLYAIVGLAIAYSTFRLGRRQLLSSAFIPLIGERRAQGLLGKTIDILAIFATVFGTAASLGVGALQISSGFDATGLISNPGILVTVGTIIVLGLCFLVSAASGVGKGIQYISNANMVMAVLLALFVFVLGPTVVILNMIPTSLGAYFGNFFDMASRTADSSPEAADWLGGWTIFYWAWWTSWSPFVGMFLARISRGRTIREFVIVILMVPTTVTVVWFSIFGGSAVHLEKIGQSIWGEGDSTRQLFSLLSTFPGGQVASILAMILLGTFFITSADSASTVMGTMSQNGRLVASRKVTVLWGILTAVIAIVLLTSGSDDALSNLQNVTIIAASPFVLIIIGLMVAIVKALSNDTLYLDQKNQRAFALKVARERRIASSQRSTGWRRVRRDTVAATSSPSSSSLTDADSVASDAAVQTTVDTITIAGEEAPVSEVLTDGGIVEVVTKEDVAKIVDAVRASAKDAGQSAEEAEQSAEDAAASAEKAERAADGINGPRG